MRINEWNNKSAKIMVTCQILLIRSEIRRGYGIWNFKGFFWDFQGLCGIFFGYCWIFRIFPSIRDFSELFNIPIYLLCPRPGMVVQSFIGCYDDKHLGRIIWRRSSKTITRSPKKIRRWWRRRWWSSSSWWRYGGVSFNHHHHPTHPTSVIRRFWSGSPSGAQ